YALDQVAPRLDRLDRRPATRSRTRPGNAIAAYNPLLASLQGAVQGARLRLHQHAAAVVREDDAAALLHCQYRRSATIGFCTLNDTMKSPENLVWIDLEMTGLQPDTDLIIEIATIVTDKHLTVLAEGPVFAVH